MTAFRSAGVSGRPDAARRYRRVDTEAAGGSTVTTYVPDATYYARLEPVTVTEGVAEDTVIAEGEWMLALPITALAEPGDRFVVTGTGLDGATWTRTIHVTGTPGPHTYEAERLVWATSRDLPTVLHTMLLTSRLAPVGGVA